MKPVYILFAFILTCSSAQPKVYTIVIHGGAGTIDQSMPDSVKKEYLNSLSHALEIGKNILVNGGTSLDAVEKVLNYFEIDPKFNAGIGSVYTSEGTHEMDASIMDGRDLSCGAVAGVQHVPHPISLARLVMEKTLHVLLAGEGAEKFAEKMGIILVPSNYFDTPVRYKQWQDHRRNLRKRNMVRLDASHVTHTAILRQVPRQEV